MKRFLPRLLPDFSWGRLGLILLGSAIASFGLYNIHQPCGITEGGVLGSVLLLHHWLGLPASIVTPVLDISCYLLALRILGGGFIRWSILSTACVSGFFRLWECRPPVLPDLSGQPLAAAVLGALFVGLGVGLIVRQGGSSGGDDALALSLSVLTRKRISLCYLFTVSVNSRPIRNRATICGSPAIQDQYMSATGALPKNASTASPMASRNASSAIQEQVE